MSETTNPKCSVPTDTTHASAYTAETTSTPTVPEPAATDSLPGSSTQTGTMPKAQAGAYIRRFLQVILTMVLWMGLFFLAAGTFAWPRAWIFVGVQLLSVIVNGTVLAIKNPELIAERGRVQQGTKRFDKVFAIAFAPVYLAVPIVAGLDAVRFNVSALPFSALYVGLILHVLGMVAVGWAMVVNRHLETTVRIQTDRGHRVITTGPYRWVRHPMYVGMTLQTLACPLALGSRWAFVPALATILAVVIRTAFEDRTLRAELPGYEDFTRQTRYRLIPGLW